MTSKPFRCGHARTTENSTNATLPQCKQCKAAWRERRREAGTFKCGHPRTKENSIDNCGSTQCRSCRNRRRRARYSGAEYLRPPRQARARATPKPVPRQQTAVIDSPAIAIYHTEKARRDERLRESSVMADAKAAFDALLQRERDQRKGGRPGKPRRSDFIACKPEDRLLEAVGQYGGGG